MARALILFPLRQRGALVRCVWAGKHGRAGAAHAHVGVWREGLQGFIHGMGFSNYFRSLLGQESDIILPLFAFNVGVEAGQLCIVACILVVDFIVVSLLSVKQEYWNKIISSLAIVLSLYMIWQRI